ncbi:XcyI family restriction endonuclease [Herbaspirillum sp. DW155]|uniref:XcyI family restriction endonuclease n=1 Tax=Herbaspirillum sp. DW155 TaxID=3095609 RepID=UPI00308DC145|nr:XcyI family restriction endonuclease [Herbaspirillum sp. DW155]
MSQFNLPDPTLQISFAASLAEIRSLHLQDALLATVRELEIPAIDLELGDFVPAHCLSLLAGHGLRGEVLFPVPSILRASPNLLGYYRMLYGFSQKEFYTKATGFAPLKALEVRGVITAKNSALLQEACESLCEAGVLLLAGIGTQQLSLELLSDLTLLTLGPQLRGGANVRRGAAGIRIVFNSIFEIVESHVTNSDINSIELKNAAGRTVLIQFAADPDIIIQEEVSANLRRQLIAIEVKAGRDFSNIHNRLGEAEKSHQKARAEGYAECWTVVNVDKMDLALARQESPSTNRFYKISDLTKATGSDYSDFRDRIISLTGIPT